MKELHQLYFTSYRAMLQQWNGVWDGREM